MKNDREPLRKSNDKKASPINNNVVWFLLVLGVLTLLAVSMMTGGPDEKLQYSDLLELVKVTGDQGGKNYIDVHRGSGEKAQTVRFSDPTDIKLGSYEVTGKVIREVVGEPASRAAVSFQSNLKPMDDRLAQLLEEKHISFDNAEGPAAWRSYVPMLVLTGLCVAFIFYMMRRLGGAGSPMAFGRSRGKMYAQ